MSRPALVIEAEIHDQKRTLKSRRKKSYFFEQNEPGQITLQLAVAQMRCQHPLSLACISHILPWVT